jgi:DNA polymerase
MDPARSVTTDERRRALEQVAAEVAVCTLCPLHATRTLAVPGEGQADTEVVFVGEGPGYNEDQQGRPFVGAAGTLLNDLLRQIGWKRQDVYITNVVKCRPPSNRDPEPHEIAACAPYLSRQLEILDPAVVVTLGRHSLQTFNPGARISGAHGTLRPVDPQTGAPNAVTYAMYHPAAALRQGSLKQTMLEDMSGLPDALLGSRKRRGSASAAAEAVEVEALVDSVPLVESEPIAVEVEPELVAIAVMEDSLPIDENQMSFFG